MVFQAPEAEPPRRFLHAVLEGKGLLATCSLRQPPVLPSAKEKGTGSDISARAPAASALLAAAASTGDGAPSTPAALSAHISVAHLAALPASPFSLHTYPNAKDLFASTLKRVAPMWFHPSTQDLDASQLTQTLPAQPDAPNVSVGSLSTMLGAAAAAPSFAAAATAAVAAVAAAMGLQGSHSMPSPFPTGSSIHLVGIRPLLPLPSTCWDRIALVRLRVGAPSSKRRTSAHRCISTCCRTC